MGKRAAINLLLQKGNNGPTNGPRRISYLRYDIRPPIGPTWLLNVRAMFIHKAGAL